MNRENGQHKTIRITADSACDLLPEWESAYGIGVIRHTIHTQEGVFEDGSEIDSDGLCEYLRNSERNAGSAHPGREAFERFFEEQLKSADEILHVSVAKQTSRSYGMAAKAKERFPEVRLFDTGDMAGGAGLFVMYAAHLARQGNDAEAVTEALIRFKEEIRSTYALRVTSYLQRGGRMSPFLSGLLTAFLLHPLIVMKHDRMNFRFTWSAHYREDYIRRTLKRAKHIDPSLLIISHAALPEEELAWIRKEVLRYRQFDRVICVPASAAVTANLGEGTFGLVFRETAPDKAMSRLFDFLPLGEEYA